MFKGRNFTFDSNKIYKCGPTLGFQTASLLASGGRPITAVQCLLQATADRKLVACADLNLGSFRSN